MHAARGGPPGSPLVFAGRCSFRPHALAGWAARMRCAAIDIGSNTTRVLVAEPDAGQLRGVMDQKAFTRLAQAADEDGAIRAPKVAEVADAVATQVRLAEELGADAIRIVATAAIRDAGNRDRVVAEVARACGLPVDVLSEEEEGRLAFVGATRTMGHLVDGEIAVVDVGGGSTEIVLGSLGDGVRRVSSFRIGSGLLTESFVRGDPPSAASLRALRDHVDECFAGINLDRPEQAVAVGGSASSLRRLVGMVLEYETLERAMRVLTGNDAETVAQLFELDPRRVRLLPAGVIVLERISQLLRCPLQIGRGSLRDGVILDLLNGGLYEDQPLSAASAG
jgi:exopolyphosphatase/guanosine-5'-triphosphate,3'-diphosphate pyrophosphatase